MLRALRINGGRGAEVGAPGKQAHDGGDGFGQAIQLGEDVEKQAGVASVVEAQAVAEDAVEGELQRRCVGGFVGEAKAAVEGVAAENDLAVEERGFETGLGVDGYAEIGLVDEVAGVVRVVGIDNEAVAEGGAGGLEAGVGVEGAGGEALIPALRIGVVRAFLGVKFDEQAMAAAGGEGGQRGDDLGLRSEAAQTEEHGGIDHDLGEVGDGAHAVVGTHRERRGGRGVFGGFERGAVFEKRGDGTACEVFGDKIAVTPVVVFGEVPVYGHAGGVVPEQAVGAEDVFDGDHAQSAAHGDVA